MNYTLSRLPYFLLGTVYELFIWSFLAHGTLAWEVIGCIAALAYPWLLAIPRARDCGWPAWIGWLTLLPWVGLIPAVALLFAPTRMGLFEGGDEPEEEGEETSEVGIEDGGAGIAEPE